MTTLPTWPAPTPPAAANGPHMPAEGTLSGRTAPARPTVPFHPTPTGSGVHDDIQPGDRPGGRHGGRCGASW